MKALYSAAFIAVTISLASCKKEAEISNLSPTVETGEASEITRTTVILSGSVNAQGTLSQSHGISYSLYPSMAGATEVAETATATDGRPFKIYLSNLESGRTYYYRTYSNSGHSQVYGAIRNFQTPAVSGPAFSSTSYSGITTSNATISTSVTDDGGANLFVQGMLYCQDDGRDMDIQYGGNGVTASPGVLNGKNLSVTLSDLLPNTTYIVRPYGVSNGIGYGTAVRISTPASTDPTVSTVTTSNITSTSLTVSAEVLFAGNGVSITERGFCYSSVSEEPTFDTPSTQTISARATSPFTSDITGLSTNTTYYIRAYLKTSNDKYIYGDVKTHEYKETPVPVVTVTTINAASITDTSAMLYGYCTVANISTKEVGFVYGKDAQLTLEQNGGKVESTSTDNLIVLPIQNLDQNTQYYHRFYVIDTDDNVHYGEAVGFKTQLSLPTDGDIEFPEYSM